MFKRLLVVTMLITLSMIFSSCLDDQGNVLTVDDITDPYIKGMIDASIINQSEYYQIFNTDVSGYTDYLENNITLEKESYGLFFWLKIEDDHERKTILSRDTYYAVIILREDKKFQFESNTNNDFVLSSDNFTIDGQWHSYAITSNSTHTEFYQDGLCVELKNDALINDLTFSRFFMNNYSNYNLDGEAGIMLIYESLTADMIEQLHHDTEWRYTE